MEKEENPYVCPPEFAGSLDNSIRRWLHNPERILKPYIKEGMKVLDLGCGPGVFTMELARLVQGSGKVIAADLQEGMLEIVARKIKGTEFERRVELHKCQTESIGLFENVDFILAFWMVHEVPDHVRLFAELKSILKPGGSLYIIEPKIHVVRSAFEKMTGLLIKTGFKIIDRPNVFFSRAIIVTHLNL
jgi:ubiquinone/menaquinone biosynthesis C-methylase UbiE